MSCFRNSLHKSLRLDKTILASDLCNCLMTQDTRGLKYKFVRNKRDLKEFEYNNSCEIFIDFLSKRKPFSDHFDEDLAFEFYKNVRCGLLHEAQTKGGWRIRRIEAKSPNTIITNKNNKIVYRDNFIKAFYTYIDDYGNKLLKKPELQKAFIRKFDFICEEIL